MLTLATIPTPIGAMLLAVDPDGFLRAADFADREARLVTLLARYLGADGVSLSPGPAPAALDTALRRYFAGAIGAIDAIAVESGGTPFQQSLWRALRTLPPGAPLAYGRMAERLGRPQAARAVGHANGANPFCVVVPCHRLVGADGALTGYSGGTERKRWLLAHEARHAPRD